MQSLGVVVQEKATSMNNKKARVCRSLEKWELEMRRGSGRETDFWQRIANLRWIKIRMESLQFGATMWWLVESPVVLQIGMLNYSSRILKMDQIRWVRPAFVSDRRRWSLKPSSPSSSLPRSCWRSVSSSSFPAPPTLQITVQALDAWT